MALVLFLVSIGVFSGLFIYDYYFSKVQNKKFKTISTSANLEIEKLRESEKDLKNKVTTLQNKLHFSLEDPVTRLPTRELFQDRLNTAIKEGERYQLTLGLLCIDLLEFNVVYEAFGYEVGNKLLLEASRRLQSCIRQVDTIARLDKEKFVILLLKLNKPETAVIVAQRILQEFSQPFLLNDNEIIISINIGISIYPMDAKENREFLKKTEQALELAKEKGKNTYQFYHSEMQTQSQRKLAIYNSLSRESILKNCFLYYQPIINVETKKIISIEVMLSYQHPELGIVSTNEFFTIAEQQSKLHFIFDWLIEKISEEFTNWQEKGFNPELIALTLPIAQLKNQNFIHRLSQKLQKIKFDPKHLLLQLQGNFASVEELLIEKMLNMLTYLGIKIGIDNVGTAILPLHLLRFNINYLKMDAALIDNFMYDDKKVALIKSMLILGKNMHMELIAKGVDSETQMIELKKLGCVLMQGLYFYPPLDEKELVEKITNTILI